MGHHGGVSEASEWLHLLCLSVLLSWSGSRARLGALALKPCPLPLLASYHHQPLTIPTTAVLPQNVSYCFHKKENDLAKAGGKLRKSKVVSPPMCVRQGGIPWPVEHQR